MSWRHRKRCDSCSGDRHRDCCEEIICTPICPPKPRRGHQGLQGPRGFQGPQGNQGALGFQGIQGPAGSGTGSQGPQGPQGTQGTQGPQGPQGTQGPQGPQGTQGTQGTQGPQGTQGFQGPAGSGTGSQGAQGFQGNQGPPGSGTGSQGFQGPQGPQGPTALSVFTSFETTFCANKATAVLTPATLSPFFDVDIAIEPLGVGALERDPPDGTVVGGNCRGAKAVDWQGDRFLPTQVASGDNSVIGGGQGNAASGNNSVIGGGLINFTSGAFSVISGGEDNTATAAHSVISGGGSNTATGASSVISGGESNTVTAAFSVIGGGQGNSATGTSSVISGGQGNSASGDRSVIGGGQNNIASGSTSTIAGGATNLTTGIGATVSGGNLNTAAINYSTVGGGQSNTNLGLYSTISGGSTNKTLGQYSTVGGGQICQALADWSFVAGRQNTTNPGGAFSANLGFNNVINALGCAALGESLLLNDPDSTAVSNFNLPGLIGGFPRIFMVGNGITPIRSNAFSITSDGSAHLPVGGTYQSSGADFGEYFESISGKSIPIGTPVVFEGITGKIRPANSGEDPFGVVSNTASFVGNSGSEEWSQKYVRNSDGSIVYEDVNQTYKVPVVEEKSVEIVEEIQDPLDTTVLRQIKVIKKIQVPVTREMKVLSPDLKLLEIREVPLMQTLTRTVRQKKISSNYDPSKKYIPRAEREGWQVVGFLGVVKVISGAPVSSRWVRIKSGGDYDLWLLR